MPDLSPGAIFAGHRIEAVAGRGGMGVVYRATHLALDHVVALKVISPNLADDPRFRRRFADESRLAVSIRHPNVVRVHHAGEEDGLLFVTMDLIEGTDLRVVLRLGAPLAPEHAAAITEQVAAALDAAHARGLVHRDIKPGNVLIEKRSEGEHVYLTDFGLARQVDATSGVTATGAFVGTLDYVAPEQIKGERVDARADIYALGCVVFEMLSGHPPFAARDDKVAKMYGHIQEQPPRLRILRPDLPGDLDLVVARALEKHPGARFPSAGDFARAATAALEGQPTVELERSVGVGAAAPPADDGTAAVEAPASKPPSGSAELEPTIASVPPPTPRPPRRSRLPLLGGLAALVVAAVVAALVLGGADEEPEPAATTTERDAGRPRASADEEQPFATVEKINVPGFPVEAAFGEGGLWVTSRKTGQVSLIEDGGDSRAFEVGGRPEGIAVGAGSIWVADFAGGEVLRLDRSGEVARRIGVGGQPSGVAFGEGDVWVSDYAASRVLRIDPDGGEVAEIGVGTGPHGIGFGEGSVWVVNRLADSVTRIDPGDNTAAEPIEVGANPKGVAVAAEMVFVTNTEERTVSVIDPGRAKVVETIGVGDEPRGIVAAEGLLWVANGDSNSVTVIEPGELERVDTVVGLSSGPEGIAAGGGSLWVPSGAGNQVNRITHGE